MADTGVIVTLRLNHKPEQEEALDKLSREFFIDTRQKKGCRSVHAYRKNDSHTETLFLEEWDSIADYDAYLNWRKENGTLDRLNSLCDRPPVIEYWPQKID